MNQMNQSIAAKHLGYTGRLLSISKSEYTRSNPGHKVIFNSNVCTKFGKIWYGDIDLTKDKDALQNLANELNEVLYVLYEMDGRFKNEENPRLERAAFIIHPNNYNINQ